MENEKHLLTIKEFAALANVSVQAIYKQLDNKLKTFSTVVDNKKMIDIKALKEVYNIDIEPNDSTFDQQVDEQVDNQFNRIIDILEKQLEEKDKQIAELHQRLDGMQQLVDQQQKLSLIDKNKILELENKLNSSEQDQEPEQEADQKDQPEPEQKKKWWQRLFG